MPMHSPAQPGEILRHDRIPALNLTEAEAATMLGVDQDALVAVLDGHAPVTAELAMRLAESIGSTAEFWLRLQAAYDLAQVRHRNPHLGSSFYDILADDGFLTARKNL